MKTVKHLFVAIIIIIALCASACGQYQWHLTQAPPADTVAYNFIALSCSGESCSALAYSYKPPIGADSNIIFHSNDGGLTWRPVQGQLPQWLYFWDGKGGILLQCIEQIDSLDAIASGSAGTFIRTFDGWKTWQADTFNFPPLIIYYDTQAVGFTYLDFSDMSEGVLDDAIDNLDFWTSDSGKHWTEERYGDMHPYGNGMWREWRAGVRSNPFDTVSDTILTTHDNWNTVDTTTFFWNGPFSNGLSRGTFYYGAGDTLFSLGYRFDSLNRQIASLVRSTDLGAHWVESAVPKTNRIAGASISGFNSDTLLIVGEDSTGEILVSTDRGISWTLDTVPLDNGAPYFWIRSIAVTGSGRILASIAIDSNVEGSGVLAYLEPVSSRVAQAVPVQTNVTLYPNPATSSLTVENVAGTIAIADPLGRTYSVPRNENMLDVSSLPTGMYFVVCSGQTMKFVKN